MKRRPNKSLDRMTTSAVTRRFHGGRPRRTRRHRSAWRSLKEMECTYTSEDAFQIEGRGYIVPGMPMHGWPVVGMTLDSNVRIHVEHVEYILMKPPSEKLGIVLRDADGETASVPPGDHRFSCPDSPENVAAVQALLERSLHYAERVLRDNELKNFMCSYETSPALADRVASLRSCLNDQAIFELGGIFGPTGEWDDLGAPSLPAKEVYELLCMYRAINKTTREQVGAPNP